MITLRDLLNSVKNVTTILESIEVKGPDNAQKLFAAYSICGQIIDAINAVAAEADLNGEEFQNEG